MFGVASESGERTRLACWRWRPRHRELFPVQNIAARRAMGTRGRVRSPENTAMFVIVLNSGVCSLAVGHSIDMFPQGNGYSRASSSLSRFSNKAIVLLIGSAVVMSTPASRNVSSGNFDPPDLRKPRYFSTAPGFPWRTRSERVTAADSPVAYL